MSKNSQHHWEHIDEKDKASILKINSLDIHHTEISDAKCWDIFAAGREFQAENDTPHNPTSTTDGSPSKTHHVSTHHITYRVSQNHSSRHRGSLVDRCVDTTASSTRMILQMIPITLSAGPS
jgi:hypothetical protein